MSKLIARTEEQKALVEKLANGTSVWFPNEAESNGFYIDDYITFDEMAAIVGYLQGLQDKGDGASAAVNAIQEGCKRIVGAEFDKDLLKVGDKLLCHSNKCAFSGEVNHIDGRDVLIVIGDVVDPLPIILPAVKNNQETSIGNMQVGGEHYQQTIQPVEYIHANGLPFIEGNVVKYISRHKRKGGAQDVEKAMSYCAMLLKMEYGYTDEQISKLYGNETSES